MKYIFLYFLSLISVSLSAQITDSTDESGHEPFLLIEQLPEFPGGDEAMMNFIGKNLRYPAYAQENDIQGTVLVNFIVNEDGSISDFKITKSPDTSLDRAAIGVLNKMPKWKHGIQAGKAVKVYFDVPINFAIADGSDTKPIDSNNFIMLELTADEIVNFGYVKKKVQEFKYYFEDKKPKTVDSKLGFKKFKNLVSESFRGTTFYIYAIKLLGDPSEIDQKFKISLK